MSRWLWRFDWDPEQRDLVCREAEALRVGGPIAPGLFVGSAPFEPGRAAFGVGGGEVLSDGPPGSALPLPAEARRVHVPRGPWKSSGNPVDLLAQLGPDLAAGARGSRIELYAADDRWLVVRTPPGSPHFEPPDLPFRTSTSLSSRLARAVVNLVARPGERVLDPVCGTGVLLVEAARIGCDVVGGDLNRKACYAAQKNLAALGLRGEIRERDALAPVEEPVEVLVGDLPYGRRLEPTELLPFVRALPSRARRWALVADVDLGDAFREAGQPLRYTVRVPKPTFSRYVFVGGESA